MVTLLTLSLNPRNANREMNGGAILGDTCTLVLSSACCTTRPTHDMIPFSWGILTVHIYVKINTHAAGLYLESRADTYSFSRARHSHKSWGEGSAPQHKITTMFIISTTTRDGRNITQYAAVTDTGETRIDTIEWTGNRGSNILYRECNMDTVSGNASALSVVTDRDWQSPPLMIRLPVSGALFTLIISFSVDTGHCRFSFEPSLRL